MSSNLHGRGPARRGNFGHNKTWRGDSSSVRGDNCIPQSSTSNQQLESDQSSAVQSSKVDNIEVSSNKMKIKPNGNKYVLNSFNFIFVIVITQLILFALCRF